MSDDCCERVEWRRGSGLVAVREMGLQGMVTLRADLAGAGRAVKKVTGTEMPAPRGVRGQRHDGGVDVAR
jgi:sarcosine oxidase subunit gamma